MPDETHSAETPTHEHTASKYELIIVASREARRLNDYYRQRAIQPKRRITSEAIDRVFEGPGVAYEFISARELTAAEETPADTEA